MVEFNDEFYKKARENRPYAGQVAKLTAQALAAYYGDDSLYDYTHGFSEKEDPQKLAWRRERTAQHYHNYVKQISAKYVESVYGSGTVTRKIDIPDWKEHQDLYSEWFSKDVAPFALFLPELWIGFQSQEPEGEIKTLNDARQLQGMPRPTVIYPNYVRNYEVDHLGRVKWVSLVRKEKDKTFIDVWTETHFCCLEENGAVKSEPTEHNYGFLPFYRMVWEENNRYENCERSPVGHAMMFSIIQHSLATLQFMSMLVEAGYLHLNLKLAVDKETAQWITENGISSSKVIIKGSKPESKEPSYLQIPYTEFDKLIQLIYEKQPEIIFNDARLLDRRGGYASAQSGISKLMDLLPETKVVKSVANYLQRADKWVCSSIKKAMSNGQGDAEVTYPSNYEVKTSQDITTDITGISSALSNPSLPQSPTIISAFMESLYLSLVPNATPEQVKALKEEMEQWVEQKKNEPKPRPVGFQVGGSDITPEEMQALGIA